MGGLSPVSITAAAAGGKSAGKKVPTTWTGVASRLWDLAWPLSGMEVLTFAKEIIITAFVGHLGPFELSSLVLAQTLYNVSGNAPMLGIVVAMETFCGQAYGARKYATVGVVLQRALLITTLFNLCCVAAWGHAGWLMEAMGQAPPSWGEAQKDSDPAISAAAGRFTVLLAPALVMDGIDQCCRRYLLAQSISQPQMFTTLIATLCTPFFLWFFIVRCDWGFDGAAVAWNCVQAGSMSGLIFYLLWHNSQQDPGKKTWGGWTREAFTEWWPYIHVALPSMVMICLDWWTFELIVILSGLLPRPEITMSMMGITFNVHALCFFAAHGLSGAASTRVGNELGAGRPRLAWLNTQVSVLMGTVSMIFFAALLMAYRHRLGGLFSLDPEVMLLTSQAVPMLAVSLIGEGANTVLAGVLRGCGRQKIGATINLIAYWGIGLPISCVLAFKMGLGAMGLWTGLACTASLQSLYLSAVVFRFDWSAEATRAKGLIASGEAEFELEDDVYQDIVSQELSSAHGAGGEDAQDTAAPQLSAQQSSFEVGDLVEGGVQSVQPYGVFLKLGNGAVGLLHISRISQEPITAIDAIFSKGDRVKVLVLAIDQERGRLTLSTKPLEPTPGDMLRDPQLVFDKAEETAEALRTCGYTPPPTTNLQGFKGDSIKAVVIQKNEKRGRVSFSTKHLEQTSGDMLRDRQLVFDKAEETAEAWRMRGGAATCAQTAFLEGFKQGCTVGDVAEGSVQSLRRYGAFVELSNGVVGLLPISKISHEHISSAKAILSQGERIKVVVLSIDQHRGQVTLSTKQSEPTPSDMLRDRQLVVNKAEETAEAWRKHHHAVASAPAADLRGFKIGDVVEASVHSCGVDNALLDLGNNIFGFLDVNQISRERVHSANLKKILSVGERIKAIVIKTDEERGRLTLSTKELELTPGDMLLDPQLLFGKAEEMAEAFLERKLAKAWKRLAHKKKHSLS
ncbi:hypothetical protein FOA52_007127 [Chlamydomonas sp. UWO 241]|nr:hypothetical protein FOA52_007127 [Chlamydomonas sp. UWO 241]